MRVTALLLLSPVLLHQLLLDGLAPLTLLRERIRVRVLITPDQYRPLLQPTISNHQYAEHRVVSGGVRVGPTDGVSEPSELVRQLGRPPRPNRIQTEDHENEVAFVEQAETPSMPDPVDNEDPYAQRSSKAGPKVATKTPEQDP